LVSFVCFGAGLLLPASYLSWGLCAAGLACAATAVVTFVIGMRPDDPYRGDRGSPED
jgi:hypothetical protein